MDADHHPYRTFACTACGYTFQAPVSCGNRFCATCSGPRRHRAAAQLRALVSAFRPPPAVSFKLLTLTIRSGADLSLMHRTLIHSFRRLRSHNLWQRHVLGGAFVLELTGQPGKWHLHLHAVLLASYVPWSLLLEHWQKVAPGRGVWIANRPPRVICRYLTKYLTKNELSADIAKQAALSLRSARLFTTFGVFHHLGLRLPPQPYPCPKCHDSSWYPLDLLEIINKIGYLPRKRKHERAPSCQD